MQSVVIEGQPREGLGRKASVLLRREGNIPCVVYAGAENLHFYAPVSAFRHLIYTPEFKVAEIHVGGKKLRAIVKELQFHPVSDALLHVDFLELVPNQPLIAEVPLRIVGNSTGVKKGGKLVQKVRKLKIKTVPENLVDAIEMDITELDLGKSMRVRDLNAIEGIEFMNNGSIPVVTIEITRSLRSAAAEEAAAAAKGSKKK